MAKRRKKCSVDEIFIYHVNATYKASGMSIGLHVYYICLLHHQQYKDLAFFKSAIINRKELFDTQRKPTDSTLKADSINSTYQ